MNNMNNIYKEAARLKLRINIDGMVNVEDLFDIKLEKLNEKYISLNKEFKELGNEEGLLGVSKKDDTLLKLQLSILEDVVSYKLDKLNNAKDLAAKKEKYNRLVEMLSKKQDEELGNLSKEEIVKQLEELGL